MESRLIETYFQYMPKDTPVEDWESRNALYALYGTHPLLLFFIPLTPIRRNHIIDSALYPKDPKFRNLHIFHSDIFWAATATNAHRLIAEVEKLVEQYPQGYVDAL